MTTSHSLDDPLCAFGGTAVRMMEVIVYHPACVAPTTRREPPARP
ncbi:MAG: hypothetical protein AB7R89_26725 [Dehalococcoidia bacterium]